ncbi:MAG: hypothetical protein EAX96_04755 [Candidatus Lokiarchaeota archaeon]|nr:hypothetical protein [Candidatus Lokiarchaeota archaeon]
MTFNRNLKKRMKAARQNIERGYQIRKKINESDVPNLENIILSPIIIGHSCGYEDGYGPIYSTKATHKCVEVADYLEIDVWYSKKQRIWRYYHPNFWDKFRKRKKGICLKKFFIDFSNAIIANNRTGRCGIFIDMKSRVKNDNQVESLMELIEKYVPKKTPLIIFTGRSILKKGFRDSTTLFLEYIYNNSDFWNNYPITISTREINIQNFIDKIRNVDLRKGISALWEKRRFNWTFNPYHFWKIFYKFEYMIQNNISFFPWITNLPSDKDTYLIWDTITDYIILKAIELNLHQKNLVNKLNWGIITFVPTMFSCYLKKRFPIIAQNSYLDHSENC